MNNRKEYILCAAIHYDDHEQTWEGDGNPVNIKTGFVLCGYRHDNIMKLAATQLGIPTQRPIATQGFLTSRNRFVDREEAADIARAADQLIRPYDEYWPVLLFSEHIY